MSTLKGCARLLRGPQFLTAVSDAVAGYLIALLVSPEAHAFTWGTVALVGGTSAGLYLVGTTENDLADLRRDRLLRALRPLVTGDVGIPLAVALLVFFLAVAGGCASRLPGPALLLAIGTFAAINLYNLAARRGPAYIPMILMGLCRLLNFGIGVAAASGIPIGKIDWALLLPSGPLWVRHGLALFFAGCVITGYSIAAKRNLTMSSRPWQVVMLVGLIGGLGMWVILSVIRIPGVVPPFVRVFALLVLASAWPGRLWSATGHQRKPDEYAPFATRALYWLILMDVAFVLDAILMQAPRGA